MALTKIPPIVCFLSIICVAAATTRAQTTIPARPGVSIKFELPTGGPLPRTYRVTLAIVDPKNRDWIISQFARGEVYSVTEQNQGKCIANWDGLDDNFMPVPPGEYAVKGICMPAAKWQVDDEYHSITPRFVTGASAWLPTPEQWNKPEPFGGDPCGSPFHDIAVGPNGIAVFYYQYLENGLNCPMFDLNKPVNYEQFLRAFNSGGTAGGPCVATDGTSVWALSTGGGPRFVYRADEKSWGSDNGAYRNNVYRPPGNVTSIVAWRDENTKKSFVYVAQRAKLIDKGDNNFVESESDFVNKITIHDGDTGAILSEISLLRPQALAVNGKRLYALHAGDHGQTVSSIELQNGLPRGEWSHLFDLPPKLNAFDLKIDSHGRLYVSDPSANHVYQFDSSGKILLTYGRHDSQTPGEYDGQTLMSPSKLATWTDRDGNDRLLIVEAAGPNRASEWSSDGKLLREFLSLQTHANDGYAIDPDHVDQLYILGHEGWLTRFKVDYAHRIWTVDAVWPSVGTDSLAPGFDHPVFIRRNGCAYLACTRSYNIYRLEQNHWLLSAAVIRQRSGNQLKCFFWNDQNGDGIVQESEYRDHPFTPPGQIFRYHGEQWLDDLSLVALNQAGPDIWRLAPSGFDPHGNPIFREWTKLLTDPVFVSRAKGTVDAVHGGNELDDKYSSDWAMADGSITDGFYVNARGGRNFSANEGAQAKISRYVPDASGGYKLKWRTGRAAMQRLAEPGEIYGAIHIRRPINGLLSVIDQSRCGVLLYTTDGLYVDSIFPDGRRFSPTISGVYPQPGEFFAGMVYPDPATGKIYFGSGKYTPMIFEAQGWSLHDNPVRPLAKVQETVRISAAEIAAPPEIALSVRGGSGAARFARFAPALGGVSLDSSMTGWESCDPIHFESDATHTVEVRCLYDPDHLYLRWHARTATMFRATALDPIDRIFTHDRLADTLSFYLQGDPNASPGGPMEGRSGDVRFVFGLFDNSGKLQPAALGMYPIWNGPRKPSSLTYATPTNKATFANVGPVDGAQLFGRVDDDGKGFLLVASIPRKAMPGLPALDNGLRTMGNFSATFSGHDRFWWANSDGSASRETYDEPTEARLYPGSWAPVQFTPLVGGIVIRNWLVCGPFGGPGAEKFLEDPRETRAKDDVRTFCDPATFPPDDGIVNPDASYSGEIVHGYWRDPGKVSWKIESIADLDTRVILGPAAQVWYGVTWIHTPADTSLEFQFQGHPQTNLRFFVNNDLVRSGEIQSPHGVDDHGRPSTTKTLTLRQGWNQIRFRGYCVGYPPFRAGLVLSGPAGKLWRLKLSTQPPTHQDAAADR